MPGGGTVRRIYRAQRTWDVRASHCPGTRDIPEYAKKVSCILWDTEAEIKFDYIDGVTPASALGARDSRLRPPWPLALNRS